MPALINSTAASYGVPPSIALAVATRESGLNQSAVGTKGELGVFQLMPSTAAGLGVDPSDLTQNVQGGISYLAQLYRQFGDWRVALEAYNGGPGNVSRGTVPAAAVSYADAVLASAGADTLSAGGLDLPAVDISGDFSDAAGGLSGAAWLGLAAAGLAVLILSAS